ncbi:hypothetical protein B0J13DRAFT_174393 [Dactylonectria estremocensis]|uniref:Uncharacterized protein n=1 Tax=Dactylonectria estremocensis TaxID=1079267 RepID=A0A9P9FBQ2_9HYPO|nr:hypothetical protein B0J13DRAFT_174393 [Dactylonectria estremocensis]
MWKIKPWPCISLINVRSFSFEVSLILPTLALCHNLLYQYSLSFPMAVLAVSQAELIALMQMVSWVFWTSKKQRVMSKSNPCTVYPRVTTPPIARWQHSLPPAKCRCKRRTFCKRPSSSTSRLARAVRDMSVLAVRSHS